jgi:lysophospholipase L1-like esterase
MAPNVVLSAIVLLLFAFVQCSLAGDSLYDDLLAAEQYAPQWEIESTPAAADPSTASPLVLDYGFKDQKRPQLVFFGDSITNFGFTGPGDLANQFKLGAEYKGWALQLNDTLGHAGAMLNLAFKAGTNTKGLNQSLPLLLEQMKPVAQDIALVNLAFGANDAVMQ